MAAAAWAAVIFGGVFDLHQPQVMLPEFGRIGFRQIRAQQVASLTAAHLAQLRAIEPELKRCTVNGASRPLRGVPSRSAVTQACGT